MPNDRPASVRALEAELLHVVEQVDRRGTAERGVACRRSRGCSPSGQREVVERHALGQDVVEDAAADGREDDVLLSSRACCALVGVRRLRVLSTCFQRRRRSGDTPILLVGTTMRARRQADEDARVHRDLASSNAMSASATLLNS